MTYFRLFSIVFVIAHVIDARSHSRALLRTMSSHNVRGDQTRRLRGASSRVAGRTSEPEQLEDWKDSGKAAQCTLSDDRLMSLGASISTAVYGKQLHEFIDVSRSRYVANTGNGKAGDYITKAFKDMGLNVSHQSVVDSRIDSQYERNALLQEKSPSHKNVIGYLQGTDLAHEVVLLGAHYDSVNWENTTKSAPGVDDNGSGIALLLSVARAIAHAKEKPRRSIMFVAFNAEEEGLVGSTHFAKLYAEGGTGSDQYGDLKAVFIADEVAWPGRGENLRSAIFETSGRSSTIDSMVDTLARLALLKNATSDVRGDGIGDGAHNFLVNYHGFGSDHIPFLDAAIPAVLLIEGDDVYHADTWGHSARDTFDHVDMSFGAAMSRLALRAVASFATPV